VVALLLAIKVADLAVAERIAHDLLDRARELAHVGLHFDHAVQFAPALGALEHLPAGKLEEALKESLIVGVVQEEVPEGGLRAVEVVLNPGVLGHGGAYLAHLSLVLKAVTGAS